MASDALPTLPVPPADLVKYIAQHPQTPMVELLEPYRKYEAHLREAFAQDPGSELLKDPHVNVLPLFTDDTPKIKIRARNLKGESDDEKSKYIMPLTKEVRRPDGSPAIVQSLKDFQRNFNVFSESSLVELDWSNVVAAGSSVVNCLLPVPDMYNTSKRKLREFYHEKFCPASDVDLFLYGLTEEQAIEKIKDIETRVRDALLTETTTVRTKHAITICSQYPTRHIQIVLRIYKSVSEILTGFDIDCSGAAYDGKQVYCTPRALQSYMTQVNHIDLSRRSPSYENRLSKYSHRGFEVYWPDLDRSRIDPTIFERSFQRTLGLARLLILERLPTTSARDSYQDRRRAERGRPPIDRYHRHFKSTAGDIKEEYEDEVADWFTEDEVSNYHTFTIPYGPKLHAKKIEKLCYSRDLLLNAEWNQPEDREVYLHRHPAFFGRFEDVAQDCCGYCPIPQTEDEKKVAEEEGKIYVSGSISFIKDDPGRQQIGSFNPLNDDGWTEMAYIGDTARLCQAIVDGDVEHVSDWLSQEGADPNTRDHTGRTPLHLATMSSTPEVVRALVNGGARLISRLADGRTALHLAAARGNVEIVKILMDKSVANEAEHEEKQDQRRWEAAATENDNGETTNQDGHEDDESDGELVENDGSEDEAQSMATGSFVKIKQKEVAPVDDAVLEENEEDPDFYDINVLAWDIPFSALHFAIVEGHAEVVKTLVQEYGADVLLPVKLLDYQKKPQNALLTLVLALALPVDKAKEMVETLISLGATSAQADMKGITAFHRFVEENAESLLDSLWTSDPTGTKTAINHIAFRQSYGHSTSPLQVAIRQGNTGLVLKLLDHGAVPHIDFETWLKSAKQAVVMEHRLGNFENNQSHYREMMEQPLITALRSSIPEIALELLERGADPNVITCHSHQYMGYSWRPQFNGQSALDIVNEQLETLRKYDGESEALSSHSLPKAPSLPEGIDTYLSDFEDGSYQHWLVAKDIDQRRASYHEQLLRYEEQKTSPTETPGVREKASAIGKAISTMTKVKEALLAKGAKPFVEIHPQFRDCVNTANPQHMSLSRRDETKTTLYSFAFYFLNVNDETETRKKAYNRLFNAAWNGDLETIKMLTLTSWDDAKEEPPLKIAVYDQSGNNPFSLAFSRHHYDVAKAVLEIAHAQYVPEEKPKTRYREDMHDDPEYSDGESVATDDSGPNIYGHIIDAQFTIENVGQVSMKVNSRTKPQEMVEWTSPLRDVISNNDMQGLKFLISVGEHWSAQKLDPDDEVSGFYRFPDIEFQRAIELGRVELLGEIIKRTGAGLPLEHLVKHTGVELKEQPRYYQGLTVYGEKKKDWAAAGRVALRKPAGTETSPLLLAALAGRIESVEWFLSDTPLRHYLTFVKSKAARDDLRLKHLEQAPGGFDGAISSWLNDQNDLVLHAAISAFPRKRATELVSYLVKTYPSSIDVRAANGVTPLLLACKLGRPDVVKILINAGADQTAKDRARNNLLHAALEYTPCVKRLKPLLDLLDRDLLVTMLKERNNLEHNGRTPLHQWLHGVASSSNDTIVDAAIRVFNMLVNISPETAKDALRMLDGAGDTPLHTILSNDADPRLVRTLLEFDPSLLFCENAVGRTPGEFAHDRFRSDNIKSQDGRGNQYDNPIATLVSKPPSSFVEKESSDQGTEQEPKTIVARNWRLCAEMMARAEQPKRTLVSLHSANFVAQRLGEAYMRDRYRFSLGMKVDEDAASTSSEPKSDNVGNKAMDPEVAPALKSKPRRRDIISSRHYSFCDAWKLPCETKEAEDDGDGADDEEAKPCSGCWRCRSSNRDGRV
ncbi:Ankyrin repeat protein [Madurella fahalii]|uniref:Ankyrin repeat protein n=1 Tax=Madurella fahalii TaxID=1157608 RepID=A0ABQ0FZP2_9PEZI